MEVCRIQQALQSAPGPAQLRGGSPCNETNYRANPLQAIYQFQDSVFTLEQNYLRNRQPEQHRLDQATLLLRRPSEHPLECGLNVDFTVLVEANQLSGGKVDHLKPNFR
jgi:hypothetical protein